MLQPQWQIVEPRRPRSEAEVLDLLLHQRQVGAAFLSGSLRDLEPHLTIAGMEAAAELMAQHLARCHKLVLIGDYDCDGVTALAQLVLFLKDIGYSNFAVVIPTRAEGYGIPERAIFDHPNAKLFVAVDCGTLDVAPIRKAAEIGADCIVIDHHEVPNHGLAPATVLINPKQPGCPSTFKEFCASGLALLFLAGLRQVLGRNFPKPVLGGKYLTLATIGTVADLVPLTDANRILARNGLQHLNQGSYQPVNEILKTAGLSGKTITAGHLGFYVGPRLNAAGRIADPRLAFDLLVAEQPDEIRRLAAELNRLNASRQHQEHMILAQIRARFAEEQAGKRTVVMGGAQWPAGIVGIVASRIQQELHYGPTIVLSMDEASGLARGSARSVPGFDIHAALQSCDDLLVKWGGHKMAAGLTLAREHLAAFGKRFEAVAQEVDAEVFIPRGRVDMELDLDLVSSPLLEVLEQLEPHGMGNPVPTFAARQVTVDIRKTFGREHDHLRLLLDKRTDGIFWRGLEHYRAQGWREGDRADVIFKLDRDAFTAKPVLTIKDIGRFF